jgi:hypothetical protein
MYTKQQFQPENHTKKTKPLFFELGNLLNLVRNFNALLNNACDEQHIHKEGFNETWYFSNPAISNIQIKLNKLETDIAKYFANYSTYYTHNSSLNWDIIQQKLIPAFKVICNEYFSLQISNSSKNSSQISKGENQYGKLFKLNSSQLAAIS